jgi:hypothetical protein
LTGIVQAAIDDGVVAAVISNLGDCYFQFREVHLHLQVGIKLLACAIACRSSAHLMGNSHGWKLLEDVKQDLGTYQTWVACTPLLAVENGAEAAPETACSACNMLHAQTCQTGSPSR